MAGPKPRRSRVFSISTTISQLERETDYKLLQKQSDSHVMQTVRMIVVMMVPVVALVSIAGVSMATSQARYEQTSTAYDSITPSFFLAELIGTLQKERGITTMFLSTNVRSASLITKVVSIQKNVNASLAKIVNWPQLLVNGSELRSMAAVSDYLIGHRREILSTANVTVSDNIAFYTNMTQALLSAVTEGIVLPADSQLWKKFVAFDSVLRAGDACGIQRALGSVYFSRGGLRHELVLHFIRLENTVNMYLQQAFRYYNPVLVMYVAAQSEIVPVMQSLRATKDRIMEIGQDDANSSALDGIVAIDMGIEWFDNITKYISLLAKLRVRITKDVLEELADAMRKVRQSFILYVCLMVGIVAGCLVLAIWYSSCINTLMRRMSDYSKKMNVSGHSSNCVVITPTWRMIECVLNA